MLVRYLNPTCAYPVPESLIQAAVPHQRRLNGRRLSRDIRTKLTSPVKCQTTSLPCEWRNDSRGSKGVETRFSHCETCTSVGVKTLVSSSIFPAYHNIINRDQERRERERNVRSLPTSSS
jgi:hypothetical protein